MKFKNLSFAAPLRRKRTPRREIWRTEEDDDDEEEPTLSLFGKNEHHFGDEVSVAESDATDSTAAIEENFSRSFSSCCETPKGILTHPTLLDSLEQELVAGQKSTKVPKKASSKRSTVSFCHVTVHYHTYMMMDSNYDIAEGPRLALGRWTGSEVFEDLESYTEDLGFQPTRKDDDLYIRPALRRFLLWQERDRDIDEACSALADYHTEVLFSDDLDAPAPYPADMQEC